MSKKFFVEIEKVDANGEATLDWLNGKTIVCTCRLPTTVNDRRFERWSQAELHTDDEVADSESEIDVDWRTGIETKLGEILVAMNAEQALGGVMVFELRPYGRSGPLDLRPRQFYVFRLGADRTLYATTSIEAAFAVAKNLVVGTEVTHGDARKLRVPSSPQLHVEPSL